MNPLITSALLAGAPSTVVGAIGVVSSTIEDAGATGTVWRLVFNQPMDEEWEVSGTSDFDLRIDAEIIGRGSPAWANGTTLEFTNMDPFLSVPRPILAGETVTAASMAAGALKNMGGDFNGEFPDLIPTNNSTRT
jgi:hypothetical protein